MLNAGIDIGARTIKLVVLEDNEIVVTRQRNSRFDPMAQAIGNASGSHHNHIMTTRYGRHLFEFF